MRRIALLLEYDGARFAGSQLQPGRPTVQGELENAIEGLLGHPARTSFAGRTDAGVHARGQVASFAADLVYDAETVRRAINARLPEDVVVRAARDVDLTFDPRRHATSRTYRYTIVRGVARSPLRRRDAWCVRRLPLLEEMQRAAEALVGRHDFRAFAGEPGKKGASTIRRVYRSMVTVCGDELHFDLEGDAFLPHQVRITAGGLVRVGQGNLTGREFEGFLQSSQTGRAGPAAPPEGLCLLRVTYRGLSFDADQEEDANHV